jgi:hypothetical protein
MQIGVEQQVNHGNQCSDNQDENRDADFMRDQVA